LGILFIVLGLIPIPFLIMAGFLDPGKLKS
jgi:hypothetical protein